MDENYGDLVELHMLFDEEEAERRDGMNLSEIALDIASQNVRLQREQVEELWPELNDADVDEVVLLSRSIRLDL